MTDKTIDLNGTAYTLPARPVAVVCIDGGDPEYIDAGVRDGIIPNIESFMKNGFYAVAQGSMPSFTCPNNMSIVTGTEPVEHGISGNFYLDRKTGEPVVMTDPELLRKRSIMSEFSRHGSRVVSITAKDKLRKQLQKDMDLTGGSVSMSSQYADRCTMKDNGIENALEFVGQPLPDMYSAELSLFVLDAGIKLLEDRRPDILYLSLTDFIQHTHAPGTPEANRFYTDLDTRFGRLKELGAIVALTADHGMGDKADADGNPNVIWLQDILDDAVGAGACRVICPITDAFVGHHGALGGFVRVYCNDGLDAERVIEAIRGTPGIEKILTAKAACRELEQPLDREGDVAVLADKFTVIGSRAVDHDLSGLKGHRLRTHGSLHEANVPFVISEPLNAAYAERGAAGGLRSHQLFDFAINGTS
ncbi:MAG: phosphonoacetate hydrolase [Proteobacteria bacterium]|nr:phosphonoacetate hydrolase [Rhodospirillaceae bacterium]MDA0306568.1 phosphonoacetate hydrolase [Pseudomonadota bacterium]MDA1023646.1 phosphonoacetate hydrolase [Pseudomonadota bacterium]